MQIKIDHSLATQIVNTVKDVCGQDVNFIDQSGIIFASTNPERVELSTKSGRKLQPQEILSKYLLTIASTAVRRGLICRFTITSLYWL